MKSYSLLTSVLLLTAGMSAPSVADKHAPLTGPYLGQTPPGLTPVIFAPGVVSVENRDLSGFFSPDMTSFHFTRKDMEENKWTLITFEQKNNVWAQTQEVPRIGRPIYSPDGSMMHLGSRYKHQTENGWSDVQSLGAPFTDYRIMRLSSSSQGTYVFDEATRDGKGLIRYSRVVNGKRQAPQAFPKSVNTGQWNAHPFIAPDESYVIWDGERASGFGEPDLYISFKQADGSWSKGINMGDKINTATGETGAYVTPDGKYLFFNRKDEVGDGNIYWVDARIIDELKSKI